MLVTVVFNLADERQAQAFDAAKAIISGEAPANFEVSQAKPSPRTRRTAQTEQDAPKTTKAAEPTHTLEELRTAVTSAQDEGVQRSEIKALLTEFGATKVPELKPENYDEFATKLQKLVEDAI